MEKNIKIIHCADIHLDSVMTKNLDSIKAKERKQELLRSFTDMVSYAKDNKVRIIIIAGDLFDTKKVSKTTKDIVFNTIKTNDEIDFLYLKGNHDASNFLDEIDLIPENLKLFNSKWTKFEYDNLVITGIEDNPSNSNIYHSLILEEDKFNIVVMHGQESNYESNKKEEIINLPALKNKNIDYLALGHIHTHKVEKLDNRGVYAYSGCLEARGYDEVGKKGFVLLELNPDKKSENIHKNVFEIEFIPFSKRIIHEIKVDITETNENRFSLLELTNKIQYQLQHIEQKDLVKVILEGKVFMDNSINLDYIKKHFENDYYTFKIVDNTKLNFDIEEIKNNASLKGEFVRTVYEKEEQEDDIKAIIEYGIRALAGEEL